MILNPPEILGHVSALHVENKLFIGGHAVAAAAAVKQVESELMDELAVVAAFDRILRQHFPVRAVAHLLRSGRKLDLAFRRAVDDKVRNWRAAPRCSSRLIPVELALAKIRPR